MSVRKGYLPPKWVQWQRYRYQYMLASGLAAPIAYELAAAEAKWRYRASKALGFKAACDTELVELVPTDKGFGLKGNITGLTDDEIGRLGIFVVEVDGAAA